MSQSKEQLLALLQDAAEHVAYLHELGVEQLTADALPFALPTQSTSTTAEAARIMQRTTSTAPSRSATTTTSSSSLNHSAANAPPPRLPAALQRNAEAASAAASKKLDEPAVPEANIAPRVPIVPRIPLRLSSSNTQRTNSPRNTSINSASQNQTGHINMPRKIANEVEHNSPVPQDTLFGEITPQTVDSLPRTDETIEDIRRDIGDCTRCPLYEGRTKIVHSEGNLQARLMFVGEAPGADEDASGHPFVGRAGQLLNKIIEAIGLKREDIFIGNVNRCRPPQNRTPTPLEAKTCKPFLMREIAIVQPDVIVVLGNTAMKNLLDTKEGITKIRGTFQDYKGIKVMPTFHPAYLLRDPSKKRETWEDMKTVRDYLQQTQRKNQQPEAEAQTELGLKQRDETHT